MPLAISPIHVGLNNYFASFLLLGIYEDDLRLPLSQEIWRQVNMWEMR